jgi:hypothetical protein
MGTRPDTAFALAGLSRILSSWQHDGLSWQRACTNRQPWSADTCENSEKTKHFEIGFAGFHKRRKLLWIMCPPKDIHISSRSLWLEKFRLGLGFPGGLDGARE